MTAHGFLLALIWLGFASLTTSSAVGVWAAYRITADRLSDRRARKALDRRVVPIKDYMRRENW